MENSSYSGFGGFREHDQEFHTILSKMKTKRTKKAFLIIFLVVLALVFAGSLLNLLMEYWQIKEIGPQYTSVFWTNFYARILTHVVGFLIIFIALFLNLLFLKRFAIEKNFDNAFVKKKWPYVLLSTILSLADRKSVV